MELLALYVWLKLNFIIGIFIGALILSILIAIGGWAWTTDGNTRDEDKERVKMWKPIFFKRLIPTAIICLLMAGMIPSRTDVAVLVGGHYALKLSETPEAGKIMSLLRKKANEILDSELAK